MVVSGGADAGPRVLSSRYTCKECTEVGKPCHKGCIEGPHNLWGGRTGGSIGVGLAGTRNARGKLQGNSP